MKMQVVTGYLTYGCTLLGVVLCHSLKNSVLQSTNELIKRQSIKCNTDCPYGFVADVEGDLTCRCRDPCSNIMCIASVCVVKMPANCQWESCEPETRCEVKPDLTKVRKEEMISPNQGQFQRAYVQDDPKKWWPSGNGVCEQGLPEAAVTCKNKRKRWFYNPMTGQCEPFQGCSTTGNNFSRKKHCKSRCRRNVVRPEVLRAIVPNDFVCLLPKPKPSKSKCEEKKLWFFNDSTGKCEKYYGCETDGNSFTRKVFCKATCRNQMTLYRVKHRQAHRNSLRPKSKR